MRALGRCLGGMEGGPDPQRDLLRRQLQLSPGAHPSGCHVRSAMRVRGAGWRLQSDKPTATQRHCCRPHLANF